VILVTHHVEEIPAGFSHALILKRGRIVAAGPIDLVLTGPVLSEAFGLPIAVERSNGRFRAWFEPEPSA
jgi:iron complex transport system ATP-binding protein